MPANVTSQRCWCGRAARTTSSRSSVVSTDPGARRSDRSEDRVTLISPRRPWARPIRPTSRRAAPGTGGSELLDDVDRSLDAFGRTGGARDLSQRLDHTTATADETAHVALVGVHQDRHLAAALDHLDVDGVRLVGDGPRHVLDDGLGATADDAVALGADLVLVVVVVVAHSDSLSSAGASAVSASALAASAAAAASAASACAAAWPLARRCATFAAVDCELRLDS